MISPRNPEIRQRLKQWENRPEHPPQLLASGKVVRMVGLTLEVAGCELPVGGRCLVESGDHCVEAEVVGFAENRLYLMPVGAVEGITPGARVLPQSGLYRVGVGQAMLGRVINAAGQPMDGGPALEVDRWMPLNGQEINPLTRPPIRQPLDTGIRALNGLLSVGQGQRIGLMAGSGVGKSVLMGMIARFTAADVVVVGLVGERGREVQEFIRENLGEAGMKKAVVVAAPADLPPLMRLHGALMATTVAEYFRDQGKQVLLLLDSLTRFAQAQREISLAIGEPPATRGYTPSVFAQLPRLVERAGTLDNGGSITGIYTVLAEGDDQQDPIVDAARAILDGHVVLSRSLAEQGVYPAVDVDASISRLMEVITDDTHKQAARQFRRLSSVYQANADLITVGAYQPGSDPQVDEAIRMRPALLDYLRQPMHQACSWQESVQQLQQLFAGTGP